MNKTKQDLLFKIDELENELTLYKKLLIEHKIKIPIKDNKLTKLSNDDKIAIFSTYFKGREDCYAIRWENKDKSGYAPSYTDDAKYLSKLEKILVPSDKLYKPLNKKIIYNHLKGNITIGIYPILDNQECYFVAFDFDDFNWKKDTLNFIDILEDKSIEYLLEISRSGNGAHVWLFFKKPVLASDARRFGRLLIKNTIDKYGTLSFKSFDRMFPSQDNIKKGGIGNLIALPLNGKSGLLGNTLFVNKQFIPYDNQFEVIANTTKISKEYIVKTLSEISNKEEIGVFNKTLDNNDINNFDFLDTLTLNVNNEIKINKIILMPKALIYFKRLSSVVNPEFYKKTNMRVSTYGTARIIELYKEDESNIYLPVGLLEQLLTTLNANNIMYKLKDKRIALKFTYKIVFKGKLQTEQEDALKRLLLKNNGIFVAPTGFGKTVLTIALIAKRAIKTLIIVNRVNLANHWYEKLHEFTNITNIGRLYSNFDSLGFDVDIATIQSLSSYSDIDKITSNYGLVIVDEVHHLAARSYETVIRKFNAKYLLGLTATFIRSDGLEAIINILLGPKLIEVNKGYKNNEKKLKS